MDKKNQLIAEQAIKKRQNFLKQYLQQALKDIEAENPNYESIIGLTIRAADQAIDIKNLKKALEQ